MLGTRPKSWRPEGKRTALSSDELEESKAGMWAPLPKSPLTYRFTMQGDEGEDLGGG